MSSLTTTVRLEGCQTVELITDEGGMNTYLNSSIAIRTRPQWVMLAELVFKHFGEERVPVPVAAPPEPCAACAMRSEYYAIQEDSRDVSGREEIDTIKETLMTRGRR